MAVYARHKLIVEQHVTNAATDTGLLTLSAGAVREALDVERIDALTNMRYYEGKDIEAREGAVSLPISLGLGGAPPTSVARRHIAALSFVVVFKANPASCASDDAFGSSIEPAVRLGL